jgi:hypothetical protein
MNCFAHKCPILFQTLQLLIFSFLRKYTADVPNPIIPNPASRIQNITGVSSPVFGASVDIVPDGVSII